MMMREEKEDVAVTSNGTNDDEDYTNNNINSCSGSDNNRNGDVNQISRVWGTWEELLLTCAVKRHGSRDWDSVAKEVGSRSSLNAASARDCRLKYQDLKRRFDDEGRGSREASEEERDGEIVEKLRSLRVAELRREVQRCDDSILSLQLKVKKLEEEKDGDDGDDKPDLKPVRSLTEPARLNRETTESNQRSMNESNSTASVDKTADHERVNGDEPRNPDPAADEGTVSRRSGTSHSGESETSTGPRKRTRRGQRDMSGEDSSIRGGSGGGYIKTAGNKSQPLVEIIKLIRSHPRGSVFESRLRSQETKGYKGLIRQHLDIKTIEKKMEKGSYVSSSLSFYRDLKLLFTNAIVFFPTSSSEYMAAQELRTIVSNEMKEKTGKSIRRVIKADAVSLVSTQKPSAPPTLVACKKKSPKKTHPSSSLKQKDGEKVVISAARSSRRTSKGMEVVAKDTKMGRAKNNKKQKTDSSSDDDGDKEETPKTDKKKRAVIASEKKKSVAEFLKRIKTNSPQKGKETASKDEKKSAGNVKKAKPRELRSNSTGKRKVEVEKNSNKSSSYKRKQSKKEAEEVTHAGRETGKDNQQPKKRSRR
ncbi:hypothetical protein Bca4012_021746 [Brassica carinata]|uniref:Bromo domain-containing protein n=1 Tax=Brassica carinata TaxID=52824 RepID=A0A8X7PXL4_BRACI|nr:hypothetical protein Bca52824_077876 [Brassica carinata]